MSTAAKCRRSERIELRVTPEERDLIDRAVAALDTDLASFALSNLTTAARRALADRTEFTLDADAWEAWEALNRQQARDLPSIRDFMQRPSPFIDE